MGRWSLARPRGKHGGSGWAPAPHASGDVARRRRSLRHRRCHHRGDLGDPAPAVGSGNAAELCVTRAPSHRRRGTHQPRQRRLSHRPVGRRSGPWIGRDAGRASPSSCSNGATQEPLSASSRRPRHCGEGRLSSSSPISILRSVWRPGSTSVGSQRRRTGSTQSFAWVATTSPRPRWLGSVRGAPAP